VLITPPFPLFIKEGEEEIVLLSLLKRGARDELINIRLDMNTVRVII